MPRRSSTRRRRQKRNVYKTRKSAQHHHRQKGGGESPSYCAACGKPLHPINFVKYIDYRDNTLPGGTPADKVLLPDTKWMGINIGYDIENHVIVVIGADSYGESHVLKSKYQSSATNERLAELKEQDVDVLMFTILNDGLSERIPNTLAGIVLHRDCLKVLISAFNEVSFEFINKLNDQMCANDTYSDYDIESSIEEEGVDYYESPLLNSKNRKAILDADCDIMREKKTEELARRRRVVNAARAERTLAEKELPPGISNIVKNFLRTSANITE